MLIVICKNNAIGVLFIQEGFFGEKGGKVLREKGLPQQECFLLLRRMMSEHIL